MASIILLGLQDTQCIALVKLYKDLFQTSLKEAKEQISLLVYKKNHEALIPENDIAAAAHFVYQAKQFGMICQLKSGLRI